MAKLAPPPPTNQDISSRQFRDWFYSIFQFINQQTGSLGTMAYENADSVAITGGSIGGVGISGSNVNSTPIGTINPSTGKFTSLQSTGTTTIDTLTGYLKGNTGVVSAVSSIPSSDITGLGTMSTQNANSVAITGGSINGTSVGATTPARVNTNAFRTTALTGYLYGNGSSDVTASTTIPNTAITGLGTMSTQNANAVAITGGSIDNTPVGTTTPSTGKFTSLEATGALKADTYQDFTPISAPSYQEGRVWYDSTQKTLSVDTDVANNNISLGLETQLKVYNATGSTIAAGACVYIVSGGSYSYPNVALAQANNPATSNVIGLTTGSIPNNSAGYVTTVGALTGISTGAIAEGTILYLSPYSAGQYMTTYPPTGYAVQVGIVAHQNTPNGVIYVKQSTPLSAGISVTITTAKLTVTGTNGSMTFTNGILTAQTQAT